MKLIVGLGNPGSKFAHSRHNVGFYCVDCLAKRWGGKLAERRKLAMLGVMPTSCPPVVLAKPRTFMNLSGEGVGYILTRFAAGPEDLVVIYDDMDLPLGMIRVRPRGGDGGHNGIKSIITTLGTQEFPRIRVGIGDPPADVDEVSYVLGSFSSEEKPEVEKAVETVAEVVECLLREDIEIVMNKFNRRSTESS